MAVCSVVRPNLNSDWVEKIFIAFEIEIEIVWSKKHCCKWICAIASICGKIAVNLMGQIENLNLSIA